MDQYSIQDFTRCPESSCENFSPVQLDYEPTGDNLLLTFYCPECSISSMQDDLGWYVRCPNCHSEGDQPLGRVDCIDGVVRENGEVSFHCQSCGHSVDGFVNTRWDDKRRK